MMKPIPQTFRRWGFTGQILKREGNVVLAEKQNDITPEHKYYEVMVLHIECDKHFPNGKFTPAHEALPSAEMWGSEGWSCTTLEEAEKVMARTLQGIANRSNSPLKRALKNHPPQSPSSP